MSQADHPHKSVAVDKPIRCMVFTSSDSQTLQSDVGGGYLAATLSRMGHQVLARRIVADEVAAIRALVLDAVECGSIDVLLITGGTSVAPRDVTPDAVTPLFTKRLSGFGETFRQLFFQQIGPLAILSRAEAGIITRTLVFLVPGSPDACRLAMDALIGPTLGPTIALMRTPDA